jgi:hypothetical protein
VEDGPPKSRGKDARDSQPALPTSLRRNPRGWLNGAHQAGRPVQDRAEKQAMGGRAAAGDVGAPNGARFANHLLAGAAANPGKGPLKPTAASPDSLDLQPFPELSRFNRTRLKEPAVLASLVAASRARWREGDSVASRLENRPPSVSTLWLLKSCSTSTLAAVGPGRTRRARVRQSGTQRHPRCR